jgi:hypothetical protein
MTNIQFIAKSTYGSNIEKNRSLLQEDCTIPFGQISKDTTGNLDEGHKSKI